MKTGRDAGFTLIEVVVALAVLAVASVGLIRAVEAHIDLIGGVRARTVAQWVAANRLAELEAAHAAADGASIVEMLSVRWRVDVRAKPTDDPDLAAVEVAVAREGARGPLVTLGGFVDKGG